jgi:hypothetical protein
MQGAPITDPAHMFSFVLAGNATCSLRSKGTGTHYTYRVNRAKAREGQTEAPLLWFVGLLTGPNNREDYNYIGVISARGNNDVPVFRTTAKTRNPDSPSVKGFKWFSRNLFGPGAKLGQVEFWHEGTCGKCGRALTDPTSLECGIGPVCRKRMGVQ